MSAEAPLRSLVLTSTFPRHSTDPTGRFLLSLLAATRAEHRVVCPADASAGPLGVPNVRRRPFRHRGVFYGAGAVANLRSGQVSRTAVLTSLLALTLTALREARRADVVWSHWAVPAGVAGALCRLLLRRPHVLLLHSADVWLLENAAGGRRLARFVARFSDALYAVSDELAARFEALSGRQPEVLSCGVEPHAAARTAPGPPRVGSLSRLVASKGLVPLVERAGELAAELHVAGDGPLLATLRRQAPANVVLPGAQVGPEKQAFLAALDVFVAPYQASEWGQAEGLPVSVLEAMAAGCPVVCFVSSVPAALQGDAVGVHCVADGDWDGLMAAIAALLADPSRRGALGDAARRAAADHALPIVAERWSRVLACAAQRRSR